MFFANFLKGIVKTGKLTIIDGDGKTHTMGDGAPEVVMKLHDPALHRKLALNPQLYLGEGYMDGTLTLEVGTAADLMQVLAQNLRQWKGSPTVEVLKRYRQISRYAAQYNPVQRAQENVSHHYDLSDALYEAFLDADKQYSCAYFADDTDDLETAQARKKRHIAAKLLLEPGKSVLDIGSGWGGLGLYLAQATGADVTGVTLSTEQHMRSNARAEEEGLSDRARFNLIDYRKVEGTFDRIVSVGMFEHVGIVHYRDFFAHIRRLLKDDGVALIHAIGRSEGPSATNPWIKKYIFPGGYTPALSEVLPAIEQEKLIVTDIEILRLHYAETLKAWRERFLARWDDMAALYDERFCRMWEFYLAASEMAFRHQDLMVFQIQLAKRVDTVPLTRDYMVDTERALPLDAAPAAQPQNARKTPAAAR